MFPDNIPANPHGCPVDDLEEGDNAEAKKETKESAKGRDKLNRSHQDSSLQLFHEEKKRKSIYCKEILTHNSLLSKEDVEGGKVFLPSIVRGRPTLGAG